MIDNCDKLIEKGPEKLMNLLSQFILNTNLLKIILITNKPSIDEMVQKYDNEMIIEQLPLLPLRREDAVRMMFLMCKHLPHFI